MEQPRAPEGVETTEERSEGAVWAVWYRVTLGLAAACVGVSLAACGSTGNRPAQMLARNAGELGSDGGLGGCLAKHGVNGTEELSGRAEPAGGVGGVLGQ